MAQARQDFSDKCKTFFLKANNGDPITIGQLARVIREACPTFKGSDQEIAQMFIEIDLNHDKLISWEEFSSALNAKDPSEVTRAELELAFNEIDKDGSGRLDKSEIRRLCVAKGVDMSEEALTELVNKVDHNGDEQIDKNEFLEEFSEKLSAKTN